MKKIFLLILVLGFFGFQVCLADELDEASGINDENAISNESETTNVEEINNIFTNDPQNTMELHGYLEYDEIPDNTVYLDQASKKSPDFKPPIKITSKSLLTPSNKKPTIPQYKTLDLVSKFSTQEYDINEINSNYSEKAGRLTFGTMYNSDLDNAQINYSTGFFTRYDWKKFAIASGYSRSTNSNYDSYYDKVYFAPEFKITKRLSILDIVQSDVQQIKKKNEIVLRYTPNLKRYADEVQFEIGAGQYFREDEYVNSAIRFSTRFKL
ncbi:MAG TPA: hypothetical protein PKI94_05435 [Candidatus Gastranaerophilaceae bacterium]|nr:hypothetical protein [Candidatus Gastranaerophilaceae bacterium]